VPEKNSRSCVGEHAVVLGAGMAGLLTARVLSESFRRVTVVDRDELPTGTEGRRGVPQGRHLHALLPRGRQVLDELFPGITEELVQHGAVLADPMAQVRFQFGGHRLSRAPSPLRDLFASRPLLESTVRARVRQIPEVTVRDRCDVLGPVVEGGRVTGVHVADREPAAAVERLTADLVVDATGRGSRTPAWLEQMGLSAPPEERVEIRLGYTSGRFRLRPGALDGDVAILTSGTPQAARGGALFPIEGGLHMVTLAGTLGDRPPVDLEGFLGFAADLAFPDIADALRGAVPVSPLHSTSFPASVRRCYERLRDMPSGLLVLGDALCSLDPVYGQGMTVAALEADALRTLLRRGRVPAPRTFSRAAHRALGPAWDLAAGADLADPRVQGTRTRKVRLGNAYTARFQAAAEKDADLARAFVEVIGLLRPPAALMRPDRLVRVLLRGGSAPAPSLPRKEDLALTNP
jgi:2-polyprenyl-6-methoxyphenol hydroxylase-like FAD-dependent oxidoreductase